jgi:hypothetical protein
VYKARLGGTSQRDARAATATSRLEARATLSPFGDARQIIEFV